jgi:F420-non-reducing hydrogenase iron-sulfur subunit
MHSTVLDSGGLAAHHHVPQLDRTNPYILHSTFEYSNIKIYGYVEHFPVHVLQEDAKTQRTLEENFVSDFTPAIVGFLCNWCTYAAADLAGSSKLELSPEFTVIRVMCSSRIDHNLLLSTFFKGADGILVAGCHPGDCHYGEGNYYARRRFAMLKQVMTTLDLDPERLQLSWVSAAEGNRYAEVVNEFTQKIRTLGPNPVKNSSLF